jgi:hypothetical protein
MSEALKDKEAVKKELEEHRANAEASRVKSECEKRLGRDLTPLAVKLAMERLIDGAIVGIDEVCSGSDYEGGNAMEDAYLVAAWLGYMPGWMQRRAEMQGILNTVNTMRDRLGVERLNAANGECRHLETLTTLAARDNK